MEYGLVVTLPITGCWGTPAELSLRYLLEEEIEEELDSGYVDGGDIGSGDMSIFIEKISDPESALECVKTVLARHSVLDQAVIRRDAYEAAQPEDGPSDTVVVWTGKDCP